jgi:AcrR family transcriptional regulator
VPDLSADRIAQAALAVADEHGEKGFTMRSVAEALGVTPMALYHYVDDKGALVALVVDAVISERALPAPTGSWQDDLWEVAHWMRQTTLAHPAVARLRGVYHVWTPAIFPMTERWLSLWQQSGLDLENATLAASASSVAIMGFVEEELTLRKTRPPDKAMLSMFPNARLAFQARPDRAREFELVVRSVIDGLHARLTRSTSPPTRGTRVQRSSKAGRPGRTRAQHGSRRVR